MSYHDSANGNEQTDVRETTEIPITNEQTATEPDRLYPLATAADAGRDNYTRVEFDDEICCILREYARKRAPNLRSIDRHNVGVAGEYAVATWLGVPLDTRITDDYEGDRGYDLEIPRRDGRNARVEVKTTRRQDPKATVKRSRIDNADWFVLCRASRGADRVEIIGYARRSSVKEFGDMYGLSGYTLVPEYLHVTDGAYLSPEDARAVHHRY
ncbi:DUF3883 domain-containing protein [Natrinema sp. 1APR25-10V2]|uniref:protein NO VEIN domain-containing protein n=1 Tax=Natrinema sp. 1APR25-10V2 TaxID=2951081 RepID=UPI002874D120|nr:DUF3883 domain-containing protein [Natrinema sp. 1APR25-10V2]MDS0477921.1 hypothetical protein [Natrinema sp. 1APR25-10V2]